MDFLNTPLFELLGYRFYPLFFVPFILIPIAVIIVIIVLNSRKNKVPSEPKVKSKKRIKTEEVVIKNDAELENNYNLITKWQKINLIKMLHKEIEKNNEEALESGIAINEDYNKLIEDVIEYINNNKYWSVADLINVRPNAVLFLTLLTASELENEIYDANEDRIVLFANAIDRINGAFEQGSNLDRAWFDDSIEPVNSNYTGNIQGKKLLSIVSTAMGQVNSIMEDGIIPEGELFTDNDLQSITESDITIANNDFMVAKDFINDVSYSSQQIALRCLIYKLRVQIDKLVQSGLSRTIRAADFGTVRAIAVISDKQDYATIVEEILD